MVLVNVTEIIKPKKLRIIFACLVVILLVPGKLKYILLSKDDFDLM